MEKAISQPALKCFSCEIVNEYVGLASAFTQELSEALVGPMRVLFVAIIGLWIVIQGYKLMLGHGNLGAIAKEFVFVFIAWILLAGQGPGLASAVFEMTLTLMGSGASVAMNVGAKMSADPGNGLGGMAALVETTENALFKIIGMGQQLFHQVSLTSGWVNIIYGLLLVLPYFLILVVYFAQVVIAIFRVQAIAAFSPWLMLGFGFGWGRGMAVTGLKTLLSSFMILFASTIAVALVMYGTTELSIEQEGEAILTDVGFQNTKFLLAVALGILGVAFMTEANSIANSITQTALSNSGIGTITAGVSTAAFAFAKGPGKWLGDKITHPFDTANGIKGSANAVREQANKILERVRNINIPG